MKMESYLFLITEGIDRRNENFLNYIAARRKKLLHVEKYRKTYNRNQVEKDAKVEQSIFRGNIFTFNWYSRESMSTNVADI